MTRVCEGAERLRDPGQGPPLEAPRLLPQPGGSSCIPSTCWAAMKGEWSRPATAAAAAAVAAPASSLACWRKKHGHDLSADELSAPPSDVRSQFSLLL